MNLWNETHLQAMVFHTHEAGDMTPTDFIFDTEGGTCLARVVEDGKVFDATIDGRQIGTVSGRNVYDMQGNLVGHLRPDGHFEGTTPKTFKNLLRGGPDAER
jgi:hypothetical protein